MTSENVLKTYIQEILEEIFLEKKKFNPKLLNQYPDPRYANQFVQSQQLQILGRGSSRKAYLLDSKRVLKVAWNDKGIGQNEAEIDAVTNPDLRPIFAKIYDYGENSLWLVSELVKPIQSKGEFKELTGMDFEILQSFAYKCHHNKDFWDAIESTLMDVHYDQRDALKIQLKTSPIMIGICTAVQKGKLIVGDLIHLQHWGKTPDQRVVLLDYGFTRSVADIYY